MDGHINQDRARRALARYEASLLGLPDVVGAALGERATEAGTEVVIQAFVSREPRSVALPHELDGVPVVVERSGPFEAEGEEAH